MIDFRIAGRYASSLFQFAIERNELEEVHAQFQSLAAMLEGSRELREVMTSPIIPVDKKKAILHKLLEGQMGELGLSFIDIVVKKRRETSLQGICMELHRLYNELKNIVPATVSSATKLNEDQIARIIDILREETHKEIELKTKVDPSLIGGLVVSIGDKQIDASVSKQIRDLRKEFSENPYQVKY